jgi:hypothetical protein
MKYYNTKQNHQLEDLGKLIRVRGPSPSNRRKITVVFPQDGYNRDIVFRLNVNNEETHECIE